MALTIDGSDPTGDLGDLLAAKADYPTGGTDGDVLVKSGASIIWSAGTPGPAGPTGSGAGDVISEGGGYIDNRVVRYNGTSGTSIQNSLVSISDVGAISTPNNTGSKISFYFENLTAFPAASDSHGAVAHNHENGKMYYAHAGVWIELANMSDIPAAEPSGSGSSTFSGTTDATSAGLTIDEVAYPAITRLDVTSSGTSAYLFSNQYSGNNPTIFAISGTTIAFNLNHVGHPFLIRFSGANYNTGLIHVTTTGTVTTGSAAQGKTSGTLYWQLPANISGSYGYLCQSHSGMAGTITVKDIATI